MSIFGKLVKTAFDTALLPVALAKDVVTMGGACTSQIDREGEPYIFTAVKRVGRDMEETRDEIDEL